MTILEASSDAHCLELYTYMNYKHKWKHGNNSLKLKAKIPDCVLFWISPAQPICYVDQVTWRSFLGFGAAMPLFRNGLSLGHLKVLVFLHRQQPATPHRQKGTCSMQSIKVSVHIARLILSVLFLSVLRRRYIILVIQDIQVDQPCFLAVKV